MGGDCHRSSKGPKLGDTRPVSPFEAEAACGVTVLPGTPLILDGRTSSQPGTVDAALTYQWTQTAEPLVRLSDPYASVTTFVAPDLGEGASHRMVFQLFTDDGLTRGAVARASVEVATPKTVVGPRPPLSPGGGSLVLPR